MSKKKFKDLLLEDGVLSGVQDEVEKRVLVKVADALGEKIDEYVDQSVQDQLSTRGYAPARERDIDRKFRTMLEAWRNNGRISARPDTRVTMKDMLDADAGRFRDWKANKLDPKDYVAYDANDQYWQSPMLLPRVISTLVREPAEVVQVLTPLLQRVRWEGPGTSILFPAVSSYTAGNLDMGAEDRYPEGMLEMAGTVVATIGKCGIKIRATAEMLEWNMFDVWGMHLRAAGTALGRWKEQKVANHITNEGTTQFDNSSASPSSWTHGRDASLLFNGTFSLQDLHDMYSSMLNDGFVPNALIMNPMAWTIFAQDPTMRNWAYAQAAQGGIWERVQGEVAALRQWVQGMNGSQKPDDVSQIATTYTNVPELFPYPLRIIVSPFVPYNPTNNTTSIILCDTNELGVMTVAQELRTVEWDDPEREIKQIAMNEKYAINMLNEGKGVRQAKNVIIARSYDIDDKIGLDLTGPVPTSKSFTL